MPERHDPHEPFAALCRKAGWKCTVQRRAVYDFIRHSPSHPGVDEVWMAVKANMPHVTRESVYRILNELAEQDAIQRIDRIASARYDSITSPHGHFICERCGTIMDFPLSEAVTIPENLPEVIVRHLEFRISGICRACNIKRQG